VRDGDGNGTTNDAGSAWTVGETFVDAANRIAVRVETETESGWEIYARSNTAILTATVTGPGTITASPGGISCPADCSEPYGNGEAVTLTATPTGDALFLGWSGACSGTGECVVSPSGDVSVSATFGAPETGTLDVVVTGPGSVTSDPAGITCPADCSEELLAGTSVTLTAVPTTGAEFDGWGGACSGTEACVVTIGETVSVSAAFSAALVITSAAERPGATVGASYADQLEAVAEAGTLTWSLAAGALPAGLVLASSGAISGIPEEEGAFTFTVRAASNGSEVTKQLTLAVGVPVLDAAMVVDAVIAEQSALTADARRYLDLQGNRNGRVDAGDVRAWLQKNGVVPGAAAQPNTSQEKP
ncbi:MAG: putative Ig domain-containing protein, partial [Gemmatimonadota bacterium]|nr:putative Ig domain-containing protein [Gemmatimonadota bacterium]